MIVVSCALIKQRLHNVFDICRTLNTGTLVPDKILFSISKEPWLIDEGIQPHEIPKVPYDNVEFVYVENVGGIRKFLTPLKMFWNEPDTKILLMEDDEIGDKDVVKTVVDYSNSHPDVAVGIAGNRMTIDYSIINKTPVTIYLGWAKTKIRTSQPHWKQFPVTEPVRVHHLMCNDFSLIKPKFFTEDALDIEKYKKFYINITSEFFINYQLANNKIERWVIPIKKMPIRRETMKKGKCLNLIDGVTEKREKQLKEWGKNIVDF